MPERLTPDHLLKAYALGYFPMAESRNAETIFWVQPELRGILPLDGFRISRSLHKKIRQGKFELSVNRCFDEVLLQCAAPAPDREESWINEEICQVYAALHRQGFAHSIETWIAGRLVGGLYGIAIKGAFFGESMFSRANDASKLALTGLIARLRLGGYTLLDTQFSTAHLASLGAIEIPKALYLEKLALALAQEGDFYKLPADCSGSTILQSITQTS